MRRDPATISKLAAAAGYIGVLLLAVLVVSYASAWPLFPGFALQAFLLYAAVLLGFLGGLHWGLARDKHEVTGWDLLASSTPPLWATAALLMPSPVGSVWMLTVGFALFGLLHLVLASPAARHRRLRLMALALIAHAALLIFLYR